MNASTVFKNLGYNFMTPFRIEVGQHELPERTIFWELSEGTWMGKPIYGLTIMEGTHGSDGFNGAPLDPHKCSHCFHPSELNGTEPLNYAKRFINNIEHHENNWNKKG